MASRPKVLVACEFSGRVRDAFTRRGFDAWSCDLLPTELPGQHIEGDVLKHLDDGWDLMIAHPPCTYLAVSGARWFKDRPLAMVAALRFIESLATAKIPHIAIENPIGVISTQWRKPDQIVQPWWFGDPETKATCLWLKGLPLLHKTKVCQPLFHSVHREPPGPDRQKNRSRTFQGIADVMAEQWGNYLLAVQDGK
jgi:hypothetical protein